MPAGADVRSGYSDAASAGDPTEPATDAAMAASALVGLGGAGLTAHAAAIPPKTNPMATCDTVIVISLMWDCGTQGL